MTSPGSLKKIWQLLNTHKSDVGAIYFYAILNGMLQLSVPIGVQAIIGFVLGASMVTSLYILISLVVIGVFIVGVLQVNQMRILERIQQRIFVSYGFAFIDKISTFDLYKTNSFYLPEKVNRFFDVLNLQKGFSKLLLDVPAALIQILFGLILLAFYHPFFIAFGFILAIMLWIVLFFTSKKGLSTSIEESTFKYSFVAWMQEVAKSVKAFKLNHETDLAEKKADNIIVDYLHTRTSHFKVLLFQYKSLILFKTAITAFLLGVGCYLLIEQKINIGEFIAAEIVILSIIASVEKIIKNLDTIYDVLTAVEKLSSVTENYSEASGTLPLTADSVAIELIDFSFAYPDRNPLLKNIKLNIPANKTVCITGEENSGKSTLLKLLSAHYNKFNGNFLINNIPFSNYDINTVRNKTGAYFQEFELFSGTVLENITMGRTTVTPKEIINIAHQLGFDNFLQTLPAGFETIIDIYGNKLPSNIARKILLLRALVHKPALILLEEPWLGLRTNYQQKIIDFIHANKFNSTIIVASNNAAFAKKCDYAFELVNGDIKPLY